MLKIYDGDTMTLNCSGAKVKTRLYCIDAPEMKQHPWGRQARDTLRKMTPNTIVLRTVDTDQYGRSIGEIFVPGLDDSLNLQLVKQGQAAVYWKYCNRPDYFWAEQQARGGRKGIWQQTGLQQKPWVSRAARK